MNSMNFDELVQLQVLKHKASLSGPSFLIDKLVDRASRNAPDVRQGLSAAVSPRWRSAATSWI
jgi:hypothetical protein